MFKALFQTLLTDIKARDLEGIGRERVEDSGSKYRWVQNAEAAATDFVVGQVVCHKLTDTTAMMGKVYVSLTANLGVLAGVCMGAMQGGGTDVSTNTLKSFGWIQIFGVNSSISVSGATTGGTNIAAGDYLKAANSVAYAVRDVATQPAYKRTIQAITAVATTTTPAAGLITGLISCA